MRILISEQLSQHKYKTPEGYLVCVDSILARTGKQQYLRDEIFHDGSNEIVDVDRSYKEVFDAKTIASFENKPITVEHPDTDVNVTNHKDLAVGFVRDVHQGKVDGNDVLLGTLVITDEQTIKEIENGEHTDLSCGYDCIIEDNGNPEQKQIRGNHVALCKCGRAGIAKIVDTAINDSKIVMKRRDFDEALTYEGDDEPDIQWLQRTFNVTISKNDSIVTITGDEYNVYKFYTKHHLRDYGVKITDSIVEDDKPYTYSELFNELKRSTNNFKEDVDNFKYSFEKEFDIVIKILRKYYKNVDYHTENDRMGPEKIAYIVSASNSKTFDSVDDAKMPYVLVGLRKIKTDELQTLHEYALKYHLIRSSQGPYEKYEGSLENLLAFKKKIQSSSMFTWTVSFGEIQDSIEDEEFEDADERLVKELEKIAIDYNVAKQGQKNSRNAGRTDLRYSSLKNETSSDLRNKLRERWNKIVSTLNENYQQYLGDEPSMLAVSNFKKLVKGEFKKDSLKDSEYVIDVRGKSTKDISKIVAIAENLGMFVIDKTGNKELVLGGNDEMYKRLKRMTRIKDSVNDSYYSDREKQDKEFVKNALDEMRRYERNWNFLSAKEKRDIGSLSELRARIKELEVVHDSIDDAFIDNTYWNRNGRFQAEYEELYEAGVEIPGAYKYRRWYNDGDYPAGLGASQSDYNSWKYLKKQAHDAYWKGQKEYGKQLSEQANEYSERINSAIEKTMDDIISKTYRKYKATKKDSNEKLVKLIKVAKKMTNDDLANFSNQLLYECNDSNDVAKIIKKISLKDSTLAKELTTKFNKDENIYKSVIILSNYIISKMHK